jgi:hypothetical protein
MSRQHDQRDLFSPNTDPEGKAEGESLAVVACVFDRWLGLCALSPPRGLQLGAEFVGSIQWVSLERGYSDRFCSLGAPTLMQSPACHVEVRSQDDAASSFRTDVL